MSFLDSLEKNINEINNLTQTENGALGFKSTEHPLLDMNFKVPSYRTSSPESIIKDFTSAYNENELLAILWMFYARDVRGGLGERRLFRILLSYVCKEYPEGAKKLLPLVPEYGRWDDILEATRNTEVWGEALQMIKNQLTEDIKNHSDGKSVSLLAKWLPSERTSSKKSRELAREIARGIGFPIKNYNRALVTLRKHIDIVESKMSAKQWESIDYSAVPSKANLIYNDAFLRNDEERRRSYLESLKKGETKINANTLFPHEIVSRYMTTRRWSAHLKDEDATLEELWKALPDAGELSNTIVVADGSGSMTMTVGNSNSVTALDVANGLAIYCAEHCSGEFHNKYITFSETPQFVNFSHCKTLREKISEALKHDEVANTNIEAVFDLILDTAIQTKTPQEELPKNILIISDMEFDSATGPSWNSRSYSRPSDALFEQIKKRYEDAGYQIPRLVFWNVNSRTNTIPIKENELGVALVSGFSISILNMVQNGEVDPYVNLVKTITSKRYHPIVSALS